MRWSGHVLYPLLGRDWNSLVDIINRMQMNLRGIRPDRAVPNIHSSDLANLFHYIEHLETEITCLNEIIQAERDMNVTGSNREEWMQSHKDDIDQWERLRNDITSVQTHVDTRGYFFSRSRCTEVR